LLALALGPATPATASEQPLRLPDAALGPVLAGDEVVQGKGSRHAGYDLIQAALGPRLGPVRNIGRIPSGVPGKQYDVALLASESRLAYLLAVTERQAEDVNFDTQYPVRSDLWGGPLGQPTAIVDRCRRPAIQQHTRVALDGPVLAYSSGCEPGVITVLSDEPGVEPLRVSGIADTLQVAGRYVAWGPSIQFTNPRVTVLDRITGQEVLHEQWPKMPTADSFVRGWALQADGKIGLIYETGFRRTDTGRLAWFTPAELFLHDVPGEAGALTQISIGELRMHDDRFAYIARHRKGCDRLTVTELDGRTRPVGCAADIEARFDWNGRWFAWTALGCAAQEQRFAASTEQVERGMRLLARPCPAALDGRNQTIRLSPYNLGKLRLRCPRGCNPYLEFRLPRRGGRGPLVATGGSVIGSGRGVANVLWAYNPATRQFRKRRRAFTANVYLEENLEGDGSYRDAGRIGRVTLQPIG
jgi:hypothetical protein